jgi:DNA recombination protein RmuC
MDMDVALLAAAGLAAALALAALVVVMRQAAAMERLRLLAEQVRAGQESAGERQRLALAETERALAAALERSGGALRAEVTGAIEALRGSNEGRLEAIGRQLAESLGKLTEQSVQAGTALRGELGQVLGQMREGNEARLAEVQRTLAERLVAFGAQTEAAAATQRQDLIALRAGIDLQLTAVREGNEKKLGEIQATVNEQLAKTVEAQMTQSFARVTEQFAQVQKAMGEMQAVGAQIGDIKRLFGNVKTRGGWGETQVRAMLDDVLPPGAYDTNWKPREGSDDAVEFAIIMPMRGAVRPRLPVDAKFPVEDYERLLSALDAADGEAERSARRALAQRVRMEAKKISDKYIVPPTTVEFAVMYLPTDGLYAEVARIDGLVDELGRVHRVLVMGPSLFPALLRTIHLGHVTLALEQKADEVRTLLGAARTEMQKMDGVVDRLARQAGTFSRTIGQMKTRTQQIERKLRGVETMDPEAAALLIGPVEGALEGVVDEGAGEAEEDGQ